jgi:hypothetical protein
VPDSAPLAVVDKVSPRSPAYASGRRPTDLAVTLVGKLSDGTIRYP